MLAPNSAVLHPQAPWAMFMQDQGYTVIAKDVVNLCHKHGYSYVPLCMQLCAYGILGGFVFLSGTITPVIGVLPALCSNPSLKALVVALEGNQNLSLWI